MISQNILVCYLAVTAVNIKCEHKQVTICENQPIGAEHYHISGDSLQVQFRLRLNETFRLLFWTSLFNLVLQNNSSKV